MRIGDSLEQAGETSLTHVDPAPVTVAQNTEKPAYMRAFIAGSKSAQQRRNRTRNVRLVESLKERIHCFIEGGWIIVGDEMITLNQNQLRIG